MPPLECAALCFVLLPIRSRTLNFVTKRSGVSSGSMKFSPLNYALENPYREKTHAALTDVGETRLLHIIWKRSKGRAHVILPGMKHRMEVPRDPLMGQTIVLPARFGSVITASSGTSIHSLSTRTRVVAALGFPIRVRKERNHPHPNSTVPCQI